MDRGRFDTSSFISRPTRRQETSRGSARGASLMMEILKRIGRLDRRTLRKLWLPFLIAVIFLVYPFQTTVAPAWQLRVVDDTGLAVAGIKVTEHWQHNSLESTGHEDIETTDQDG